MQLITGGAFQGKLEYALGINNIRVKDRIDGATCNLDELRKTRLVNHFHLWIKRMVQEGEDVSELVELILQENPHIVIVVDEIGSGIVPINAFEREYREITGRICCKIAKNATQVHRVFCGIGTVIKDA